VFIAGKTSGWAESSRVLASKEIAVPGFIILEILERLLTTWYYYAFGTPL
jgi:hypothetical protein